MKRALVLRAEMHEFALDPLLGALLRPEPLVVLVYEWMEKPVRRCAASFLLSEWKSVGLPEPEDFIGLLLEEPEWNVDWLVAYWKKYTEEYTSQRRKVLAVDFDGVIAKYTGWKGDKAFGELLPGVEACLKKIHDAGWWICLWTTREPVGVWHYCTTKGLPIDSVNSIMFRNWSPKKICADVYLDDRGMQFNGTWSLALVSSILNFQPHWQGTDEPESFIPVNDTGMKQALEEETK